MNQAIEVSISLHYLERKTRITGSDIAIRQLCFCGKMLERNNSFQEIKLNWNNRDSNLRFCFTTFKIIYVKINLFKAFF